MVAVFCLKETILCYINLICFLYESYNVYAIIQIGYFVLFFACFHAIFLCFENDFIDLLFVGFCLCLLSF